MGEIMNEVNPLLAAFEKIPGISVNLPSGALLYTNEVSDKTKESGEVHVRPLSIRNEMALKTPDLLISGEGIESTIMDCVDGVVNANKLYACDINTLLVAIRIATFGEDMTVRIPNPYFDKELEGSVKTLTYTIDLKNCIHNGRSVTKKEDLQLNLDNGQLITLRPLTFDTSMRLIRIEMDGTSAELKNDKERAAFLSTKVKQITENTLEMIADVTTKEGVLITDRDMIAEWYGKIPAHLYDPLKDKIEFITALGPNLEFEVTDPVTKKTWKSKVPINPTDFFATGSEKSDQTNS